MVTLITISVVDRKIGGSRCLGKRAREHIFFDRYSFSTENSLRLKNHVVDGLPSGTEKVIVKV